MRVFCCCFYSVNPVFCQCLRSCSKLSFVFPRSQVYDAVAWGQDSPETWARCLPGPSCFQPALRTWPATGTQGETRLFSPSQMTVLLQNTDVSARYSHLSFLFVLLMKSFCDVHFWVAQNQGEHQTCVFHFTATANDYFPGLLQSRRETPWCSRIL